MDVIKFIFSNLSAIVAALITILSGVIAIALIIPGDQPEKFLTAVRDFLKKFSRK
jgi:hypothetical protein